MIIRTGKPIVSEEYARAAYAENAGNPAPVILEGEIVDITPDEACAKIFAAAGDKVWPYSRQP